MSNTSINYAYFCGTLQAALESLAYDVKFENMTKVEDKIEYLRAKVESAKANAEKYEKEINEIRSKMANYS